MLLLKSNSQKLIYFIKSFFLVLGLSVIIWSCSTDTESPVPVQNEFLVESSFKNELDENLIKNFAIFSGLPEFTDYVRNDIKIYKIKYKTVVQGEDVLASGVVSLPSGSNGPIPLISAFRGTIFSDTEAPSENILVYGLEVFAAAGYATVLPDMIGFGASKDMVQHYYNKETNSRVAIDMIKASKEFFREQDILLNDQLFLVGYSQGGYITMATQQAIESDPVLDWNITAVGAGAGSYNIEFVMEDVIDRKVFTSPGFLSLIIYSYNEVNNFGNSMDYYFLEPFASQMSGLLDGSKNQDQVNNVLSDTLENYFQPAFVEGMMNKTETEMINAFRANSVHDWKPEAPLRLYHSSGDEYIPIEDSQNTTDLLKDNGADVQFILLGDKNHSSSSIDMISEVIPWFEGLRTDL